MFDQHPGDGHNHGNKASAPRHHKQHIGHCQCASNVDPDGFHAREKTGFEMPQHHQHQGAHDGLLQVPIDDQAKIRGVKWIVKRQGNAKPEQARKRHNRELSDHQCSQDHHHVLAIIQAIDHQGQDQQSCIAQKRRAPSALGRFAPEHRQRNPDQCSKDDPLGFKPRGGAVRTGSCITAALDNSPLTGKPEPLREQSQKSQQ